VPCQEKTAPSSTVTPGSREVVPLRAGYKDAVCLSVP
jgi:hypothetical protein